MDEDAHLDAAYEARFGQDEVDAHFEGTREALGDLSDCPTAFECAEWCPAPSDDHLTRCYNCCHEHVENGHCQRDADGTYCSMVGTEDEG